jgi:hypothetical protein
MNRQQLEHILRASGSITNENIILVLGSQSILGAHPNIPESLARSMEADVFPWKAPDKTDLINGTIGEITPFQTTFGYYAHGLPPDACPLPKGWDKRLHTIKNSNTAPVTGLCLDPVDLAISKLAAGRPKDLEFVEELLHYRLINHKVLTKLIPLLPQQSLVECAEKNLLIVNQRLKNRPHEPPPQAG